MALQIPLTLNPLLSITCYRHALCYLTVCFEHIFKQYQSAYIWGLLNVKKITLELGKNFSYLVVLNERFLTTL